MPVNGDRCRIGTNAVIVGNVKIGSDVLIAPLTFVNSDVPDHRMVIGNPGRVILKKCCGRIFLQLRINGLRAGWKPGR